MLIALVILLVGMALFWPIKIHARNSGQTLLKSAISDPASIGLAGMVLAGAAIVVASPLWPSLELHRAGLLFFALGCGFSILFSFATVYDEFQERRAEKRPDRSMYKRLQTMRKSKQL
jgi:hypothetical protein